MTKAHQISIQDARDLPIFVIDDALIDCHGAQIGAYGVAVYVMLARFAKQNHATILAYQTIADALKIGRTKVRDTIKELEKHGLIRIEQQTDDAGNPIASNRYTLLPIRDQEAVGREGGAATRQGVPPHDTGGVATRQGLPPHEYIDKYHIEINTESPPSSSDAEKKSGAAAPGGGGDFYKELRRRKVGQVKAKEIAERYPDAADRDRILHLIAQSDPLHLGRTILEILDGVIDAPPDRASNGAPLVATRPNMPDAPLPPAELARRMKEQRNATS